MTADKESLSAQITVDQFRTLALERFAFLEDLGFQRAPSLEESSPTGGTVVYLGEHVGFIFSLDLRDQVVGAQVVKVEEGRMKRIWEGGYSADLFMHLVKFAGYRGGFAHTAEPGAGPGAKSELELMINGWAELLKKSGQTLLNDQLDSLPL